MKPVPEPESTTFSAEKKPATCELCGEPMPPGEEMFKFHGYSGDCPKPPLPRTASEEKAVAPQEVDPSPPRGPLSAEEAQMFHDGFLRGVTAYCEAVGHSPLKRQNEKFRQVCDAQGWKTIEAYERTPPMSPDLEKHIADWLRVNQKTPEQVRYGTFPLGMVQEWIERAQKAEKGIRPDWRVGLRGTPKMRTHSCFGDKGLVVAVLPSGTYGLDDKDGLLAIRLDNGLTILERADDWVTA